MFILTHKAGPERHSNWRHWSKSIQLLIPDVCTGSCCLFRQRAKGAICEYVLSWFL